MTPESPFESSGIRNIARLDQAIQKLVSNLLLFNSHIERGVDGQTFWVKNEEIASLDRFPERLKDDAILSYVTKSFDLLKGPLYRFCLIKLEERNYRFIVVLHHIICDGTKYKSLIKELSHYYNDLEPVAQSDLNQQVSEISENFQKLNDLVSEHKNEYQQYWKLKLEKAEGVDVKFLAESSCFQMKSSLIQQDDTEIKVRAVINEDAGELAFSFGSDILSQLKDIKASYQLTPYFYSQAIFALLLHKYSGQECFGISYPIAIRESSSLIYGAQINMNIISYDFKELKSAADLLRHVSTHIKESYRGGINYGYCPIHEVIALGLNKESLNIVFTQTDLKEQGFFFKDVEVIKIINNFINLPNNLTFKQEIKENQLQIRVIYSRAKVHPYFLEKFIETYKRLFIELLTQLNRQICDISIVTEVERNQLLSGWNQTDKPYSKDKTLVQLFEAQVVYNPDSIAVVFEEQKLTYRELNNKSNQLARYIREQYKGKTSQELKPDTLIALYMDRSLEMIIGILGVLKAGGAS